MAQSKLLALATEMEQLIVTYGSELVAELNHRDELEYEKEVKNKFITLLVGLQDQRRKFVAERKKKGAKPLDAAALPQVGRGRAGTSTPNLQFVTASIPFDDTQRAPRLTTLESLIKSELITLRSLCTLFSPGGHRRGQGAGADSADRLHPHR